MLSIKISIKSTPEKPFINELAKEREIKYYRRVFAAENALLVFSFKESDESKWMGSGEARMEISCFYLVNFQEYDKFLAEEFEPVDQRVLFFQFL